MQFRAWGVLCSFAADHVKGWIVNPDTLALSINERASREAYRWTNPEAAERFAVFLRHKFAKENCIVKVKPLL